ncbi:CpeR family transcriptional regulator [Cyanobium sp. ATX 6A2]|uniref:CpeR family transcriptional regulator n=1 Tax=Cyanobium sp. ATX 6A2 TaxID=2823700 RepID=UPI0020CCDA05|nr:CpeR family transcriptional regulator [Cyanobium sp. ATX 6A2]
MDIDRANQQFRSWIRSQHLICLGQDFVFETVDQTQLERFQDCLRVLGGDVRVVRAVGNWPMGPRRTFKILRAEAGVPRPRGLEIQRYWANHGSFQTRFSEISS